MGLGLSIVGGSDTLLGAIFIHEVYQAGKLETQRNILIYSLLGIVFIPPFALSLLLKL